MKTLIIILIILSFIQSTILPINLILIILICRAFIRSDKSNLYLAFAFGLLSSHLNLKLLGVESILYLIIVQATHLLSRSRFTSNSLLIIPLTFIFLSINQIATSFIGKEGIVLLPKVFWESLIALPVFYMIRIWEESFITRKEIRLKV